MYNHNYIIFRHTLTVAYVHGFSLKLSNWIISFFSIWRRVVLCWVVDCVYCVLWYNIHGENHVLELLLLYDMKVLVNLKARFFKHDIYVVMFFMFQLTINLILIHCRSWRTQFWYQTSLLQCYKRIYQFCTWIYKH